MCPRPPDHLPPIPPPPVPPPSLPLPLLFLVLVSFLGTSIRSEFVQLVQMVDLDNVTFSKAFPGNLALLFCLSHPISSFPYNAQSVAFTENGSLVEDIQLLDTLYSEELKKRPRARKTSAEERRVEQSRDTEQGEAEAEPEARILMVGDHSLYERFLSLYGGDEYSGGAGAGTYIPLIPLHLHFCAPHPLPAYTGLSRYLVGPFSAPSSSLPPFSFPPCSWVCSVRFSTDLVVSHIFLHPPLQLDTIYGRLSFRSSSSPSRPPRHIRFRLAAPPMVPSSHSSTSDHLSHPLPPHSDHFAPRRLSPSGPNASRPSCQPFVIHRQ